MLLTITSQITLNGITGPSPRISGTDPPPVVGLAQGQLDALRELRMEWA
ncbi:hypothetical protein [Streptomyces hirsutus]